MLLGASVEHVAGPQLRIVLINRRLVPVKDLVGPETRAGYPVGRLLQLQAHKLGRSGDGVDNGVLRPVFADVVSLGGWRAPKAMTVPGLIGCDVWEAS